jgi:molybdopterin-binding protein
VFALLVNVTVSWVVFAAVTPVIVGGASGVPEITILVGEDVVSPVKASAVLIAVTTHVVARLVCNNPDVIEQPVVEVL